MTMKCKSILITNADAVNGGDAALVIGLYNKFEKNGFDVKVSTFHYDQVKKIYPNINLTKSILEDRILNFLLRRMKYISYLWIFLKLVFRGKSYKDADILVSAPGGYINSYYGFLGKLFSMVLAKKLYKKRIYMYSQSVGPLEINDEKIVKKYMKFFELFMVRDSISYKTLKEITLGQNIIQTNDAAFLLDRINKNANEKKMKVAISVRGWKHDNRNKEKYINLIIQATQLCINNGYKVEFLSTCQGISGYVDDSIIAKEIVNKLNQEYIDHVTVNDGVYSVYELRQYLTTFSFTIGTRLHMCILSMLSSTPALNISYEVKGIECYRHLGLEKYSLDYNADLEEVKNKLNNFIEELSYIECLLPELMQKMNKEANEYFDMCINNIHKSK